MNNIILIYSPSQRTGKTYLSNELVNRKIANLKDSFAIYIKELSFNLHKAVSYLPLSEEDFYQVRKDEKILERKIS